MATPHQAAPIARRTARGRLRLAFRVALLLGLLGATAWRALGERPARAEARAALARKDYRTALRRALDDLDSHPRSRDSALVAARSLSQMIYADEAEPYYRAALRSGTLGLDALQERAHGLIRSNRRELAVAACRAILARFPDDPTTLRYLATEEFTRSRTAEALDAATRLSRTAEGRMTGLALLRDIHHDARHPDEAAEAGARLLAADPDLRTLPYDRMIFWVEMAEDLLRVDRPAQARDMLLRAVERTPNAELLDLLATAYFQLDEADEAEKLWRRSAAFDPRRVNPLYRIGLLEMGRSRYAEAVEVLEKAIANDPAKLEPAHNLAIAYRALGRAEDAARIDRKVEEIRRDLPGGSGGMGPPP